METGWDGRHFSVIGWDRNVFVGRSESTCVSCSLGRHTQNAFFMPFMVLCGRVQIGTSCELGIYGWWTFVRASTKKNQWNFCKSARIFFYTQELQEGTCAFLGAEIRTCDLLMKWKLPRADTPHKLEVKLVAAGQRWGTITAVTLFKWTCSLQEHNDLYLMDSSRSKLGVIFVRTLPNCAPDY